MTRKDYILIAGALRDVYSTAGNSTNDIINAFRNGVEHSAEAIATRLAADNPRFDREHFLAVIRGEKELTSRPSRKVRGHESFCLNRGVQNDGTCPTCGESNGQHNYACTDSRVVGS